MALWRVDSFGGMIPALDERLLPDPAAVLAENCLLKTGAITPIPEPQTLVSVSGATTFAYRLPASYADSAFLHDSVWIEFVDPDTSVVRAPVVDDTFDRYYFVSPTAPPKYNTRARIENNDPPWLLGIPAPTVEPTVSPSGGASGTLETRSYVYTYVSEYGEEGPPSPPTTETDKIDATWAITCTSPVAGDLGVNRNLKKIRIYRTATSETGSAAFYFLVELTLPDVDHDDTLDSVDLTTHSILESTNWSPPPDDLYGFVLMPNGFLAGWRGDKFAEVWFSEPFRPHAWPAVYTQVVEYPVVGLGVTNQSLAVCTEAYPVTMQGVHPQYIAINKLINHEPCQSRGSILSGPEGVFYASPNGLVLVSPGEAVNITKGIISKKTWQQLLNVPRLRAARLGVSYFAYGSIQSGVFQADAFQNDAFATIDMTGSLIGVVIDPTSERVAFSMLRSELPIYNCFNDPWSGEVMLITDSKVKFIDLVSLDVQYQTAIWRSKIWQTGELSNVGAAKVFYDIIYGAPGETIRFFADGNLVLERPLPPSGELFRLPSGYKAHFIQFELEGTCRILNIQFANTVKELTNA